MMNIKEGKYMKNITARFKAAINSIILNKPEKLLLEKIMQNLRGFRPEDTVDNIKAAVDWAMKYDMLQQAYTLGQEFIISQTCECVKLICEEEDWEYKSFLGKTKGMRTFVGGVLSMKANDEYMDNTQASINKKMARIELAGKLQRVDFIRKLKDKYVLIRDNRNNLNHAGGHEKNKKRFIDDFNDAYYESIDIIDGFLESRQ
jgi:hypothetical protein